MAIKSKILLKFSIRYNHMPSLALATQVIQALKQLASPEKAIILSRFFKTGPGEYGQGDIFLGLTVPQQRAIAKQFKTLPLPEIQKLLLNPIHEIRLTGALILVEQYEHSQSSKQKDYLDFYLNNITAFNNWDLIDLSAPKILGSYLVDNQNKWQLLNQLSHDNNLWARRAAMVANLTLIRQGDCQTAITLAERYLMESHDLLHKATGWVLREVGKHQLNLLLAFLDQHASRMPRVMLRYSLEKLPEPTRQKYLQAK